MVEVSEDLSTFLAERKQNGKGKNLKAYERRKTLWC